MSFRGSNLRRRMDGAPYASSYLPVTPPPIDPGLIVDSWGMNESSGTRVGTNGHDLSEGGGAISSVVGKIGNAAHFDTAGQYLTYADAGDVFDFGAADPFLVAFWMKVPSPDAENGIFGKTNWNISALTGWLFHYNSGADTVSFYIGNGVSPQGDTPAVSFGDLGWHLVMGWYDGAGTGYASVDNDSGTEVNFAVSGIGSAAGQPLRTSNAWLGGSPKYDLDAMIVFSDDLDQDARDYLWNDGAGVEL